MAPRHVDVSAILELGVSKLIVASMHRNADVDDSASMQ